MKKSLLHLTFILIALTIHLAVFAQPVGGPGRIIVPGTYFNLKTSDGGFTHLNGATWVAANGWKINANEDAVRTPAFNLQALKARNLKWYARVFSPTNATTWVTFVEYYNTTPSQETGNTYFLPVGAVTTYNGAPDMPEDFSAFSLNISKNWFPENPLEDDNVTIYVTEFWMEMDATVVPVSLMSFTAEKKEGAALLSWQTASEHNNGGFEIQRSTDGSNWSKIGFTAPLSLNGNSDVEQSYAFIDAHPLSGSNYYRLKQTDLDGKLTYTPVRTVIFTDKSSISIYPNPSSGTFYVNGLKGNETISLTDMQGQKISNIVAAPYSAEKKIVADNLPAGTYFVSVKDAEGNITSLKIIKR